jgi:hypothetical protein
MDGLVDCPCCGMPMSAWQDCFCGACEQSYQEEQRRMTEEEVASINGAMYSCPCVGNEPCCDCNRRMARLAELRGDYGMADYLMNQ